MGQNKRNYQKELERILAQNAKESKAMTLLLHSCCAPCSSYVLEYLASQFEITVFYYNPNIYPEEEYRKRVKEQRALIDAMNQSHAPDAEGFHQIRFLEGRFAPEEFYRAVKGLEQIPEGGARCEACFRLRLGHAAEIARSGEFDYVTTTLTISPLKNAELLNAVGEAAAKAHGVQWLPSDFKKKNGYRRSVELSAEYGLYRQDYCGCVFSRRERETNRQLLFTGSP